jgi:hypothetical protein
MEVRSRHGEEALSGSAEVPGGFTPARRLKVGRVRAVS